MVTKRANPARRRMPRRQLSTPGANEMKALEETSPLPPNLSGPAAAVLVALAGAAVVAAGLLLLGVREVNVGHGAPVGITLAFVAVG